MSPEQAGGEGHRVDGRSDIFSLGVVFYELLIGRRPFTGKTQSEVLGQITGVEARPPRQVDDTIPGELERICLKALAKRAQERYTTAKDLADDLRHFLGRITTPNNPGTGSNVPLDPAIHATAIRPWKGSRNTLVALASSAILVVIAIFGLSMAIRRPTVSGEPPFPGGSLSVHKSSTEPDKPSHQASDGIQIDRLRVASDDCNWEQIYRSGTIVGFAFSPSVYKSIKSTLNIRGILHDPPSASQQRAMMEIVHRHLQAAVASKQERGEMAPPTRPSLPVPPGSISEGFEAHRP
jgi:serine/threonine protein kinase